MASRKQIDRHDAVILKMATEGAILKEICSAIGETSHFVYARLNRVGAPTLRTIGDRIEQDVRTLAAEGLTLAQISQRIGRSYHRVWQVADKFGIAVAGGQCDQPKKFDHELALAWYREGMTGDQIARHFGVSRQRISQLAAKAGLKRARGRPRKPATPNSVTLAGGLA